MSSLRSFLFSPLGWLIAIIVSLCWAIPIAWATLAIYYSNLPWAGMRLALAAAFAAFTIWAIWFSRRRRMSAMAIINPIRFAGFRSSFRSPAAASPSA